MSLASKVHLTASRGTAIVRPKQGCRFLLPGVESSRTYFRIGSGERRPGDALARLEADSEIEDAGTCRS